jgi:glycosyltransferase involved in cell wall biosynthesis
MRIWIDGQCFQTASRDRGIGRYVMSLLRELVVQNPSDEIIVSMNANLPGEAYSARHLLREFMSDSSIRVWQAGDIRPEVVSGFDSARRFSEIALYHHVAMLHPDVIIAASPFEGIHELACPFNPSIGRIAPVVQIFYDAIPERFPQQYLSDLSSRNVYFRRKDFYNHCDLILSISDFTNAEANHFFRNIKSKPIYAGISQSFLDLRPSIDPAETKDIDFLYVGAADYRKNITGLVDAISIIAEKYGVKKSLSVVGSYHQGGRDDVEKVWKSKGLDPDLISFHGRTTDEDLIRFYDRSKVVVQPSLMEGFGLTALEGIFVGTCVAGSRNTALEEIILDERALFDPNDPADMAFVIFTLSENDVLRREVFNRQKESLKIFSWQRSAELAYGYLSAIVSQHQNQYMDANRIRKETFDILKRSEDIDDTSGTARLLSANEPMNNCCRPRLAIDATSTTRVDHKTGIQRVVNKILQCSLESTEAANHDLAVIYCDDWDGWFDIGQAIPEKAKKTNAFAARPSDTLLLLDSSWEFHAQQNQALWDARLKGCEVISCLYDTIPLRHSAFCDPGMPIVFSQWFRAALSYSTGFICISKAVADELHTILKAIHFPHAMKIGYWPLGADFDKGQAVTISGNGFARAAGSPSVFLMVGTIEPRKGHAIALDAFERLWAEGVDVQLMIVGKKGWRVSGLIEKIQSHPEFNKRLILKSDVSDDELSELYRNCDALLACSFSEGFGLPIVEAGQMGKPVLASDIPVFQEVGRSAPQTLYFPTGSATGLAQTVKTFLNTHVKSDWSVPHWPTWQQSADSLVNLITDQSWYVFYKPPKEQLSLDAHDIGEYVVRARLVGDDTEHHLSVVGSPTLSENKEFIYYTVAVTNKSNIAWSSITDEQSQIPIRLGYHFVKDNGELISTEYARTDIPFVIPPGETAFLPVTVERNTIPISAHQIKIRIVQEGVAWWGSGIDILLESPRNQLRNKRDRILFRRKTR